MVQTAAAPADTETKTSHSVTLADGQQQQQEQQQQQAGTGREGPTRGAEEDVVRRFAEAYLRVRDYCPSVPIRCCPTPLSNLRAKKVPRGLQMIII